MKAVFDKTRRRDAKLDDAAIISAATCYLQLRFFNFFISNRRVVSLSLSFSLLFALYSSEIQFRGTRHLLHVLRYNPQREARKANSSSREAYNLIIQLQISIVG